MRLFFAVQLPAEARAALGRLIPAGRDADYRWVDPDLLHVTLAFLGEQREDRLEVLQRVGASAAGASRGGRLRIGAPGSFGSKRAPRVLWVDLDGDIVALENLQRRLDRGLRDAGFDLEDRPFRAHVTLARRRETAHGGPPAGWPPMTIEARAFELRELTLMHSRVSSRGPTYMPLFVFPLGG